MFKTKDFIIQVFKGRTIYRILFNWQVEKHCRNLIGEVVDLAGGQKASYYQYLPPGLKITKTNRPGIKQDVDISIDLNQPLPFADNFFDGALFFNALYIIDNPVATLSEIYRILKPGGTLYLASPFISNEMPDPHDYQRFTAEGLARLYQQAGFTIKHHERFGERFTVVSYLLHPVFMFNIVRFFVYTLAFDLDQLIPLNWRIKHPVPLGYFSLLQK